MVKVGERYKDNDPRFPDPRIMRVDGSHDGYATLVGLGDKPATTRIRLDRMFSDGKPRKYGWSLVADDKR